MKMKKYLYSFLLLASSILLGACSQQNMSVTVQNGEVVNESNKTVVQSESKSTEKSSEAKSSSKKDYDQIEDDINRFISDFGRDSDEAIRTKPEIASKYFLSTSNQHYQDIIVNSNDSKFDRFETHFTPVEKLMVDKDIITFSNSFTRILYYSDGSSETVRYQREWVIRIVDGNYYIDSYNTY